MASAFTELRDVVANGGIEQTDEVGLTGTWRDSALGGFIKYAKKIDDFWVFGYEGPFPGAHCGSVRDGIYRFAWSRFDKTLSGKGYLRMNERMDTISGGLWFNDADIDSMLARDRFIEKHVCTRISVQINEHGQSILQKASEFLRTIGYFDGA